MDRVYTFTTASGTANLAAIASDLETQIDAATATTGLSASSGAVTQLSAGFGVPVLYSNQDNHTLSSAQDTDFASWSTGANAEIFDGSTFFPAPAPAANTPHLTLKGVGTGDIDYYSFTVTQDMLDASALVHPGSKYVWGTFDIEIGRAHV